MKYFANAKCEIKFASQHLRSKYFIRVSVFHSEAISLAERRISLKKRLVETSRFFWWSRGESNPCPKIYSHIFLRVHSVYCVSEQRCRQTGCAIRIALSHDCYKRQFTVHVHRLFDTSAEVAVVLGEMRCNLGSECYVFVSV